MKRLILSILITFSIVFTMQSQDFLRYKNFDDLKFEPHNFNSNSDKVFFANEKLIDTIDYFNERRKSVSKSFLEYALSNEIFILYNDKSLYDLKVAFLGEIHSEMNTKGYLFSVTYELKNQILRKSLIRLNVKGNHLCSVVYLYHLSLSGDFGVEEYTIAKSENKFEYVTTALYSDFIDTEEDLNNYKHVRKYNIDDYGYIKKEN